MIKKSLLQYLPLPGGKWLPGMDIISLQHGRRIKKDISDHHSLLEHGSTRNEKDAWLLIADNIWHKGRHSFGV